MLTWQKESSHMKQKCTVLVRQSFWKMSCRYSRHTKVTGIKIWWIGRSIHAPSCMLALIQGKITISKMFIEVMKDFDGAGSLLNEIGGYAGMIVQGNGNFLFPKCTRMTWRSCPTQNTPDRRNKCFPYRLFQHAAKTEGSSRLSRVH